MHITHDRSPVAVIAAGESGAAPLLRLLLDRPVEELDPYALAMGRQHPKAYGAVVVENFTPERIPGPLSGCTAARFLLPPSPLTVVCGDDPAGRRLKSRASGRVLAYSDGDARADVAAKCVELRRGGLEFVALGGDGLTRVRLEGENSDLYGALAAISCALGLGMPLCETARRLRPAGTRREERE